MSAMEVDAHVILPGEVLKLPFSSTYKLGPGLRSIPSASDQTPEIRAIKAGHLFQTQTGANIATDQKRYSAAMGDSVIGQVTARHAEGYRLDLGASLPASLGALAFFNVNRKNKPNLTVGSLVYGRVSLANKHMESEVECLDGQGKAGGFGELKGGYLLSNISLRLCRRLLEKDNTVLVMLGAHIAFEIAIGMNGRIWISSDDTRKTTIVAQCIQETEHKDEADTRLHIRTKLKAL